MATSIAESITLARAVLQGLGDRYTPPSQEEVDILHRNGNSCTSPSEWSNVLFAVLQTEFSSSSRSDSINMIRNCTFHTKSTEGECADDLILINGFDPSSSVELPNRINSKDKLLLPVGLYGSTFSGTCVLQSNCRVSGTTLVKNVFVGEGASVCDCGVVAGSPRSQEAPNSNLEGEEEEEDDDDSEGGCTYGNGTTLSVGVESGGRNGYFLASDSYPSLCTRLLCSSSGSGGRAAAAAEYSFFLTILASNSHALRCDSICNSYIHSNCFVRGSILTHCSLLAAGSSVTDGCSVSNSLLLGNVHISLNSNVRCSFIADCVSISDSMKLTECVVGPDNSLSCGECLHSLLGPFVGFHHTSLLIACLWPLGRGNLGYGAMVGANHTGKAADQECLAGEGVFFGLGSKIKFPFNCAAAPYSVIAAGTVCQPQRISFPFSLILADESSNVINVIKPAWVLARNRYGAARAAEKFVGRRRSEAHCTDYPVARPSVVELCRRARDRLLVVRDGSTNKAGPYTERDIAGLGKNTLSRADLEEAVAAYTSFIRSYAMHGFLPVLTALLSKKMACQQRPVDVHVLRAREEAEARGTTCYEIASTDFEFASLDLQLMLSHKAAADDANWSYQKELILTEYGGGCIDSLARYCAADGASSVANSGLLGLLDMLDDFVGIETSCAAAVRESKDKDVTRGRGIFDDYDSSHSGADGVISRAEAHAKRTVGAARLLQELIQRLQQESC